jgi:hypothetical protein
MMLAFGLDRDQRSEDNHLWRLRKLSEVTVLAGSFSIFMLDAVDGQPFGQPDGIRK